eukprot:TCONS_00058355-protein
MKLIWCCRSNQRLLWSLSTRRQLSSGDVSCSNHYSVLKVSPNASQKQIKAAYYKQSLVLHPDRNLDSENTSDTHAKFSELNEAYKILGNNKSRKEYDQKLKIHNNYKDQKSVFNSDVIEKDSVRGSIQQRSQQFDTWTKSHYQGSLQKRNHRQNKDSLRQNISREESKQQSLRVTIVLSVALMAFVLVFFPPKKKDK